ncbi:hypothetical protein BGZ59_004666 [Podila verticillata]|nr:hypothetical protein BGZ59_004666 [Podila verticillata]
MAAKTYDVNVVNGLFSPQELDIQPGDTVRWPNNDGWRFNSGTKTKGQAYQRTFPKNTVVNYKDGVGANCINGATGTIYVGPRPTRPSETPT